MQAIRGIKEKDGYHPDKVNMLLRFKLDIEALMKLTSFEDPSDIPVRASRDKAIYIMGDALDLGFGLCFWIQGRKVVETEFGQWSLNVTENEYSNF